MAPSVDQVVLENLSTAVMLFDHELRVVAMNPAAEALLDLSANKVRGARLTELLPRAAAYARALGRVVASRQPLTERDMRLRLPGDRGLTVDCTVTPLPEDEEGVVVELVQLDHHKRITREEHLVAQNESVGALIRGLAHELRNPLGGLRGAAQLLQRELPNESLAEYTSVIIREADRLQDLLERMLGPRSLPRRRSVNVHEITERVRSLIRAESPDTVRIAYDYDPSIPELEVDPDLLIQATLNVARNAVQALDEDGLINFRTRVHRQVTIGSKRHRLVVSIEISDDGPGIPGALEESIFYPMVSGRADGTGLGLSIAQSLVSQHGGLIEFARESGLTTFSILLPVEARL